jgi:hypothetical protein
MRAALDETYPELRSGIAYVVAATVVVADEATTTAALAGVLNQPGRKRPFHWHNEGPTAKNRLVDCLIEIGAVAHICVHYPTGRKKTEAARAAGLRQVIPLLLGEGTTELIIESRAAQDARDRAVILDILHELGIPGTLVYHWRPKTEPFLWLADGVCGAVRGFLLGDNDTAHYDRLSDAGVIGELIYISDNPDPQMRKSRLPS